MSLETSKLAVPALVSCALLVLGACGDDSGSPGTNNDGTSTSSGTPGSTSTPTPNETGDSTGAGMSPQGSTGTPDPDTGTEDTTGDEDTTTGDNESTTGDTDSSSTGVPVGCTGMSFATLTSADNDMLTNFTVDGVTSCDLDITITATGGTICVADDGAGGSYHTVEAIEFMDVPPMECGIAQVELLNLSIQNTGDLMEVVVPVDGGAMMGNQSTTVVVDVAVRSDVGNLVPTPVADFDGSLPQGEVAFGDGDTTLTYVAEDTVVATTVFEVAPGFEVTMTLTGLDGSLTFAE